mgnify:CR=1 FL=1
MFLHRGRYTTRKRQQLRAGTVAAIASCPPGHVEVIANNIANVNTPGYVRRDPLLETRALGTAGLMRQALSLALNHTAQEIQNSTGALLGIEGGLETLGSEFKSAIRTLDDRITQVTLKHALTSYGDVAEDGARAGQGRIVVQAVEGKAFGRCRADGQQGQEAENEAHG